MKQIFKLSDTQNHSSSLTAALCSPLCPQNKYMQRRQDFESTHKGLCKMSQYFILLQNQNRFEDKSSAHWASRYCEKASGNLPRRHHLDEAPLSSVHTSHHPCAHCPSADTLLSSALLTPAKLAPNSLPGLKSPASKIQSLWGGPHSHCSPSSSSGCFKRAGDRSLLLEEQIKGHQFFHSLKRVPPSLCFCS